MQVFAVEPNAEFRAILADRFAGDVRVAAVDGAAEHTGLEAHRFGLIAAAQAFHWFDVGKFRAECRRLAASPETVAALVWNCRADDGNGLLEASEAVCRRHCPGFKGFSSPLSVSKLEEFFGGDNWRTIEAANDLVYPDAESFVERLLSASYAPRPGDGGYELFCRDFRELFARFQRGGKLLFPNIAYCYYGNLQKMNRI